jgi:putative SOS response-associated peptidase YedK
VHSGDDGGLFDIHADKNEPIFRMPVILDRADYDLWLDPGMTNVEAASEMLKPYDARLMRSYPVSTRVNHVGNDDAECSTPIQLIEAQAGLFPF